MSPQLWGLRGTGSEAQESLCPFVYGFFSLGLEERGRGREWTLWDCEGPLGKRIRGGGRRPPIERVVSIGLQESFRK